MLKSIFQILNTAINQKTQNIFETGIQELIRNFNENGSNWRFQRVTSLDIHLVDIIKNEDEECFRWCIFRHLNPVMSHPERISDLKDKVDQLDFKGIEFIMKLRDVDIFESKSP